MSTKADDAGAVDGAVEGVVEGAAVTGGRTGCMGLGCGIWAAAGNTIKAARAVAVAKDRSFIGTFIA